VTPLFASIAFVLGYVGARSRRRRKILLALLAYAALGLTFGIEFATVDSDGKTGVLLVAIVIVAIIIVETAVHIYEDVTGTRHHRPSGQARQPRPINAKNLRQ
jgi:uncharacterized membrane protein